MSRISAEDFIARAFRGQFFSFTPEGEVRHRFVPPDFEPNYAKLGADERRAHARACGRRLPPPSRECVSEIRDLAAQGLYADDIHKRLAPRFGVGQRDVRAVVAEVRGPYVQRFHKRNGAT